MPLFKMKGDPTQVWFPRERIVNMESAPGGLTTIVRAVLLTPKGEGLGTFEVEGLVEVLGAALDAGAPTEVGQ